MSLTFLPFKNYNKNTVQNYYSYSGSYWNVNHINIHFVNCLAVGGKKKKRKESQEEDRQKKLETAAANAAKMASICNFANGRLPPSEGLT